MNQELQIIEKRNVTEAKRYIANQENTLMQKGSRWFCANHNLELYLYEYYICHEDYDVSSVPLHKMYEVLAKKCMEKGDYEEALKCLQKALRYNQIDVEIYEDLGLVYRKRSEWKMLLETAEKMYPFCYTRRDLASYYRMIGCYYLETYQPNLAQVMYAYSNLYYKSAEADSEIRYLEAALEKKMPRYSLEQLRGILMKYHYPNQPKDKTLGILYHVACIEKKNQNKEYARILFLYLYQLTGDQEVERILQSWKES